MLGEAIWWKLCYVCIYKAKHSAGSHMSRQTVNICQKGITNDKGNSIARMLIPYTNLIFRTNQTNHQKKGKGKGGKKDAKLS